MTSVILNDEATRLVAASHDRARKDKRAVASAADGLSCALAAPSAGLARALRQHRLEADILLEGLEVGLAQALHDGAALQSLDGVLAGIANGEAPVTPERVVQAIVEKPDAAIREFLTILDHPAFVEALRGLRDESIHRDAGAIGFDPSMALLLHRAQASRHGLVGRRDLFRVLLSDPASALRGGLLLQGKDRDLLTRIGGKVALPTTRAAKVELDRCNEYVRGILARAQEIAAERGELAVGELALVLALIEDARRDQGSELCQVGTDLRALEHWLAERVDSYERAAPPMPLPEVLPFLKSTVVNQDDAIDELYRRIRRVRMGLLHPQSVAGVFLFVGPPGVGKSYLAKLIARVVYGHDPSNPEANVIMIECGRYKGEHEATALLGAAPGYVGMDAGILRNGVRDKSPCVIIFDEAERMHVGIWDSLLSMINDGVLRDTNGDTYSLADSIIVLTSNKGIKEAEDYRKKKIMGEHAAADDLVKQARERLGEKVDAARAGVREVLSPDEFWNHADYRDSYKQILLSRACEHFGPAMWSRIEERIGFNGLRQVDYEKIAEHAVRAVVALVRDTYGVELRYTAELPQVLAAENSAQLNADARGVRAVTDRYLLDEFARLIEGSSGELGPAYDVRVTMGRRRDDRWLERVELVPVSNANMAPTHNG